MRGRQPCRGGHESPTCSGPPGWIGNWTTSSDSTSRLAPTSSRRRDCRGRQRSSRRRGDSALAWRCASRAATSGSQPWLDSLWRDLRFGQRLLRKDAAVSSAAIVSLGLAIGACTAAFSLVDALILRKLPVRDPETLVYLDGAGKPGSGQLSTPTLSYPLFDRVRQAVAPQMEAFSMSHQSLRQAVLPDAGGVEEKLRTQFVSGNAFDVLGVTAILGRVLAPADDVTPGGHHVAVISHAFWKRRLGGNPDAIGQWIQLEQQTVPDRRGRAGRIHGRAARSAHGHLGSQHDVPARITEQRQLGVAAGLGTARARRHARERSTDRPDSRDEHRGRAGPPAARAEASAPPNWRSICSLEGRESPGFVESSEVRFWRSRQSWVRCC